MVDMTKLHNQFHMAIGYCIGYSAYFNKLAAWYIYYRVTSTTSGGPSTPKIKFNFPLDAH